MSGDTIPLHYVQGFKANLALTPQQTETRLVACVSADMSYTSPGKMFNADDIEDDDDEVEVVSRAPDSPESFHEAARRVGFFRSYAKGRFVEDLDTVRQMQDPTNTVMAGMMATKNRKTDAKIIETIFGSARYGENGENTAAWNTAYQIAADYAGHHASEAALAADGPLTVGKIARASTMLDLSELEGERCFIWSAKQKEALLLTTAATSTDYSAVKALVNGEISTFYGFRFFRSEQLPLASQIRSCAALVKPAVIYKERPIQNAWIKPRTDKSGRLYAYYEVERGGVRRYDPAVVKVLCKEV